MLPLDFWLTKFKEVVAFVFLYKSLSARTTTLGKILVVVLPAFPCTRSTGKYPKIALFFPENNTFWLTTGVLCAKIQLYPHYLLVESFLMRVFWIVYGGTLKNFEDAMQSYAKIQSDNRKR